MSKYDLEGVDWTCSDLFTFSVDGEDVLTARTRPGLGDRAVLYFSAPSFELSRAELRALTQALNYLDGEFD